MPSQRSPSQIAIGILLGLVICSTMIVPTIAGDPPNLLDDNRDRDLLAAELSVAFNTGIGIALGASPFTTFHPPVVLKGRVLAHPKIHNLYLDDAWDAHNPDAPTRAQLDAFTQALVTGHYFDAAAQYGSDKPRSPARISEAPSAYRFNPSLAVPSS